MKREKRGERERGGEGEGRGEGDRGQKGRGERRGEETRERMTRGWRRGREGSGVRRGRKAETEDREKESAKVSNKLKSRAQRLT